MCEGVCAQGGRYWSPICGCVCVSPTSCESDRKEKKRKDMERRRSGKKGSKRPGETRRCRCLGGFNVEQVCGDRVFVCVCACIRAKWWSQPARMWN